MSYVPNLFDVEDYDVCRTYLITAGLGGPEPDGDLLGLGKATAGVPVRLRGTIGCRGLRKLAGMRG